MRLAMWAAALFALAFATACTSSAGPPSPGPVVDSSADTSSAPPPADTTTPAPPSTPTPTKSTKPLSPFEQDPAVRALRAWATQASDTINAGHVDSAALDALMTAKLQRSIKQILGNSVGYHYPGPLPFTPTRVDATGSNQRRVNACFVTDGYGIDPKTGKPHGKYHVTAIESQVRRVHGQWLLDVFGAGSFSCKGVHIQKVVAK